MSYLDRFMASWNPKKHGVEIPKFALYIRLFTPPTRDFGCSRDLCPSEGLPKGKLFREQIQDGRFVFNSTSTGPFGSDEILMGAQGRKIISNDFESFTENWIK